MQFVKTIKKELDSICIYSKQIIVFSFWCSIILFAIALISYRMAFSLDYHQQMLILEPLWRQLPLVFLPGFIAALLGDLAHRSYQKK